MNSPCRAKTESSEAKASPVGPTAYSGLRVQSVMRQWHPWHICARTVPADALPFARAWSGVQLPQPESGAAGAGSSAQKAQPIPSGQADIQRGEVQTGQILLAPAKWHARTHLGPVQVDQR